MTTHKTCGRRRLTVLLCVLLLFCTALAPPAFAAGVTVSTTSATAYFQTYASSGTWVDIGTPQHMINETGKVAYCLQTSLNSPSNSGYSSANWSDFYDQTTMTGLRAILEHGYPASNGGFTDDQARYATANAIRFWLAERGCEGVPSWMNYSAYSYIFRAKSGYEDLFNWCIALVGCARTQSVIEHSAWMSSPTVTESGDYFEVTATVYLENCDWGYTIDESALPPGSSISGYTADSGDQLTIRIPSQYSSRDFTLKITAYDNRTTASLVFYAPDYYNQQRILTYTWSNGTEAANAAIAVTLPEPTPKLGTIRITKTDSETGVFLPGVSFELYDAAGNLLSSSRTDANGVLEFTAEPGQYYYKESGTIEGYIPDTEKHPVTISSAGQVVELTVANDPIHKSSLEIIKTDSSTGQPLEGVTIGLYDSSGKLLQSAKTNAGGKVVFTELEPGVYQYGEIEAPPGYQLDTTLHEVNIDAYNTTFKGALENTLLSGSIRVKKVDAYGNALPGAVFLLEKSEDNGKSWNNIAEQSADDSGLAVFSDLTVRDTLYRLTETQAPPGHSLQAGSIFEGMLSADRLDLSFTVCDCAIPMLPFTGSETNCAPLILLMLCMSFFTIQILKRRNTLEETL